MAGREVKEYTNLSDPKEKKWGKGKDKIDEEDITFQRMVAKMQEVAGERGGYLHGRGALDSDDLLYLKEQMEAEEDAERLLRRTEKRAFAAFKRAASIADSTVAPLPLPLRVEPKPKSGIRQQDLLKNVVEIRPKRQRISSLSEQTQGSQMNPSSPVVAATHGSPGKRKERSTHVFVQPPLLTVGQLKPAPDVQAAPSLDKLFPGKEDHSFSRPNNKFATENKPVNPRGSILGLAYESSSDEEDE